MKLITAIIRPERLEAVQQQLQGVLDEEDHYRLTVETVEGHGRQEGEVEIYRGQRLRANLVEKLKLTLGVNEAYVEKAIGAILSGARTGQVGDGKIFIAPLDDCVRIRTGERGTSAI
jgi:nitrogen regulatory protein P-II 2